MKLLKNNIGKIVTLIIIIFLLVRCVEDAENSRQLAEQESIRQEAELQQEFQIYKPFLSKYKELNANYESRSSGEGRIYLRTLDYEKQFLQSEQKYHFELFKIVDIHREETQFVYTLNIVDR
ncbi:uncharacterized protein METZ01_LOCUS414714, partial [marine metagenome]